MFLLLSIFASTLIFIVFKLFKKYKINTLQAIVANYITACFIGFITYNEPIKVKTILTADWFYGALFLGLLFIVIFNIMAITAQQNGISVASVASKMSVVIPVVFGIYVYDESTKIQKIIGIILALIAVYLASIKSTAQINFKKRLLFPILLFLGSGIIDTSIKYFQTAHVPEHVIPLFSATIFSFAALIGIFIIIFKLLKNRFTLSIKNIFGGILLGIVNYGSIYYLLKALNHQTLDSSTLFTINNVGIVMLSTIVGLLLFDEKLSIKNWIGIGLAIIAIFLVTLV